mmetsp:Transcript_18024/g.36329  ORF Transcript_18024/g.36329 Transcript_18024/m.36329 type:complete len:1191 (-) Transcript_18024:86-3658(-)
MSDKKEPRTIQVKIGQQSAREMTPDQAAEYLKCMAAASSSNPLRTDRVAFTFGGRNNTNNNKRGDSSKSSFWKISAEAKEIAANSINAAVTRASTGSRNTPSGGSGSNSSIPCTEKEMKALMSMFVEIMGLQMNTEKLNSASKKNRRKNLFRFPEDIPPPPGGWPADMMWPSTMDLEEYETEEDDVPEDDSLPDLEDIPADERDRKRGRTQGDDTNKSETDCENLATFLHQPIGYVAGIAVPEWEILERVAMEDALEQEERARKAAQAVSSTSKKGKRPSQRLTIPPSTDAPDSADKRRSEQERQRQEEKVATQWRQKVVSACQSNDAEVLRELLQEAPTPSGKSNGSDDPLSALFHQCLMDLAVQCLPKNRQSIEKGRECRSILLKYVLKSPAPQVLLKPQRNGRSVLHSCCFYGDVDFVKLILENASAFDNLAKTCEESGFSPLHYAVLSGSSKTVQLLVKKKGANLKEKVTNDTHTWEPSSGKGLTATELLQSILKKQSGKSSGMETHGMAVGEMQKDMMGCKGSSSRFSHWMEEVANHLENDSFKDLTEDELKAMDSLLVEELTKSKPDDISVNKSEKSDSGISLPNNNKKKKKKKKSKESENSIEADEVSKDQIKPSPPALTPSIAQDPLVGLLKDMGFEEFPVIEGIQACGGIDRATADLVIAWMLENNQADASGPNEDVAVMTTETSTAHKAAPIEICDITKIQIQENSTKKDDDRQHAERLATRREERRQRNREWNKKQEAQRTVPDSTPTSFPKQQLAVAAPVQVTPPSSLLGRTVEVDSSEVVSSVGDYGKDDDLTVSTIGSRTTTTTQVQPSPVVPVVAASTSVSNLTPAAQHMPPGFNSFSGTGTHITAVKETVESPELWQSSTPLRTYNEPPVSAAVPAPPSAAPFAPPGLNHHLYSGLPPGIPETHPVVEERVQAPYSASLLVGGAPGVLGGGAVGLGGPHPALHSAAGSGALGGYPPAHVSAPHESFGPPMMMHPNNDAYYGYHMGNPRYPARENLGTGYPGGDRNSGYATRETLVPCYPPGDRNSVYSVGGGLNSGYPSADRNPGYAARGNLGSGYPTGDNLFVRQRLDPGYLRSARAPNEQQESVAPLSSSVGFSTPGAESSMVDSISTGGDLGGSSLWSPSNVLSGGGQETTSSLLSHLINDSDNGNQRSESSLFGQRNPSEEPRHNSHSIW